MSQEFINQHYQLTKNTKVKNFIIQNSTINHELSRNSELNNLFYSDYDDTEMTAIFNKATRKPNSSITVCSFKYTANINQNDCNDIYMNADKITAYDRRVYNAICTLYSHGRTQMSLYEIYSVVTGYGKKKPSNKQLQNILLSINKMRSVDLFIDLTEEIKTNGIKNMDILYKKNVVKENNNGIKYCVIQDHMLNAAIGHARTNAGTNVHTLILLTQPALFTYNQAKGSLLNIPTQYIAIKDINITEKTIAFQDYFLMRIIGYKNKAMRENKIMYKTLYKEIGEEKPRLSKDFIRDRELINKLFTGWLEEDLIKSYGEIKEDRSYVGITFEI